MEVWLIGCILLDVAVILTNVGEQFLICSKWKSLDRIDHLLLSLSISDLLNGVATLSVDSWYLARDSDLKMGANVSTVVTENHEIVARIFDSAFIFSVFASVLHVIAVAVERLYAICLPRKYYIFTTFCFKCATIFCIWFLAVLLTPSFSLFTFLSLDNEFGTFVRGTILASVVLAVFIVYVIIAVFLLRQRTSIIQDFSPECSIQHDRLKRLTVICLFIGISFVVCMIPMTLSYFDRDLYHHLANFMITLNSLVNPCIYFAKVYFDSRNNNINGTCSGARGRSDTTHAYLVDRSCGGLVMSNEDGLAAGLGALEKGGGDAMPLCTVVPATFAPAPPPPYPADGDGVGGVVVGSPMCVLGPD